MAPRLFSDWSSVNVMATKKVRKPYLVLLYYLLIILALVLVTFQFGYLQYFKAIPITHTNINAWRAGDVPLSPVTKMCPDEGQVVPNYWINETIFHQEMLDNGTVVYSQTREEKNLMPNYCYNTSLNYAIPFSFFGNLNVSNASCRCVPRAEGLLIEGPRVMVPLNYAVNEDSAGMGHPGTVKRSSQLKGEFVIGADQQVVGIEHGFWVEKQATLAPNVVVHEDPPQFATNPYTRVLNSKGELAKYFAAGEPIMFTVEELLRWMDLDLNAALLHEWTSLPGTKPSPRVVGFAVTAIMNYENRRPWALGPVDASDIQVTMSFRRIPDAFGYLPPLMLKSQSYAQRTGIVLNFSPKGTLYFWSPSQVLRAFVELFVLVAASRTMVQLFSPKKYHKTSKKQGDQMEMVMSFRELKASLVNGDFDAGSGDEQCNGCGGRGKRGSRHPSPQPKGSGATNGLEGGVESSLLNTSSCRNLSFAAGKGGQQDEDEEDVDEEYRQKNTSINNNDDTADERSGWLVPSKDVREMKRTAGYNNSDDDDDRDTSEEDDEETRYQLQQRRSQVRPPTRSRPTSLANASFASNSNQQPQKSRNTSFRLAQNGGSRRRLSQRDMVPPPNNDSFALTAPSSMNSSMTDASMDTVV